MNADVSAFAHRLPSARKLWLNVHPWLGLTAGFVLSLIWLTGAFLVFYDPILTMELGHRLFEIDGPPPRHAAVAVSGAARAPEQSRRQGADAGLCRS